MNSTFETLHSTSSVCCLITHAFICLRHLFSHPVRLAPTPFCSIQACLEYLSLIIITRILQYFCYFSMPGSAINSTFAPVQSTWNTLESRPTNAHLPPTSSLVSERMILGWYLALYSWIVPILWPKADVFSYGRTQTQTCLLSPSSVHITNLYQIHSFFHMELGL
jgi:hypothetical protein